MHANAEDEGADDNRHTCGKNNATHRRAGECTGLNGRQHHSYQNSEHEHLRAQPRAVPIRQRLAKTAGKAEGTAIERIAQRRAKPPKQRVIAAVLQRKPNRTDQEEQCRDDGGQGLRQSVGPSALEDEYGNE